MTEYVHVGSHADVLASGRGIGPGQRITHDQLKPEDRHLIDEGRLADVASFTQADTNAQSQAELRIRAAELGIEGRSKLSADELRQAVAEREAQEGVSNAS